ncbi:MAG: hypothetical protein L3J82_10695 [Planctomycetes bacterium]|nr:hypothetical protein [Planctomycetota bacterium]
MELTVTVIEVRGIPSNAEANQIEGYLQSQLQKYWAELQVDYDTAKVTNLYIGGRFERQSDITDKSTGLQGRVKVVSGKSYFHIAVAFSEDPVISEFFIDNFQAIGQSGKRTEEGSDR